jgi:hypothetical protein
VKPTTPPKDITFWTGIAPLFYALGDRVEHVLDTFDPVYDKLSKYKVVVCQGEVSVMCIKFF